MTYLSGAMAKNILAKNGFPRGKKTSYQGHAIGGAVIDEYQDGWFEVRFDGRVFLKPDANNVYQMNDIKTNRVEQLQKIHDLLLSLGFETQKPYAVTLYRKSKG